MHRPADRAIVGDTLTAWGLALPRCSSIARSLLPALLAAGATFAVPAWADDAPDVDASIETDDVRGLLVTIVDPHGQLGGAPAKVAVGADAADTFWVTDEGELPDLVAGDGVLAGAAEPSVEGDDVPVRLLDGAGIEVWAGTVPLGEGVALTRIDFTLQPDRAVAKVDVLGSGPAAPSGGPAPDGGPGGGAALPTDITGGADLVVLGLMGLLGSLAGFVIGLLVARSRSAPLRIAAPVGTASRPEAPWPTPGAAAIWRVDASHGAEVGLSAARALAAHGPVLLSPPPQDRAAAQAALADVPNIVFPVEETPSLAYLLETAERLSAMGRSFLVVCGIDGVEPPEPDEARDAVLADLLDDTSDDIALLVLLEPVADGVVQPTATAAVDEQGGLRVSA